MTFQFSRQGAVAAALFVLIAAGCGSDATNVDQQPALASEATVASAPATAPPLSAPESGAEQGDLTLDFVLEARNDDYTPWLLTVVATNHTDEILVDHDTRILERWNGDSWEPVALIPFNLMTPGELVACLPTEECDLPAVDSPLPPSSTGQERTFRVRLLDDGTYRMSEQVDRGYAVSSN